MLAKRVVRRRATPQQHLGVSLAELAARASLQANSSGLDERKPRKSLAGILVFLCEYLKDRVVGISSRDGGAAVREEIKSMLNEELDVEMMRAVKQQFNVGTFYDCKSPGCMFRMLKAFIRELPTPLIPTLKYNEAVEMTKFHIRECVVALRKSPRYPDFLYGYCEPLGGELDRWITDLYDTHYGDNETDDYMTDRILNSDVRQQLLGVVFRIAYSLGRPFSDLEEFFFSLPRVNKDHLEYLGECFARMDLHARKGDGSPVRRGMEMESILQMFADTFAPHILRPLSWPVGESVALRKQLQTSFFMCFMFFIKRKHNLITPEERAEMRLSSSEAVEEILEQNTRNSFKPKDRRMSMGPVGSPSSSLSENAEIRAPFVFSAASQEGSESGDQVARVVNQKGVVEVSLKFSPLLSRKGSRGNLNGSLLGLPQLSQERLAPPLVPPIDVDWLHSIEREREDELILQTSPNLVQWLSEEHLPHTMSGREGEHLALSALPSGASLLTKVEDIDDPATTIAPGEGLLHLLGPEFLPQDTLGKLLAQASTSNPGDSLTMPETPVKCPPVTQAINYDYALAFPRTFTEMKPRDTSRSVVQEFLQYPKLLIKDPYPADRSDHLLNYQMPKWRAEEHPGTNCESCGVELSRSFSLAASNKRTHCRYCGKLLCLRCCDRESVIPAYILTKADFETHNVCHLCDGHLQRNMYLPLIEFDRLSLTAVRAIGSKRINSIRESRHKILDILYLHLLTDCPSGESMVSLLDRKIINYLYVFTIPNDIVQAKDDDDDERDERQTVVADIGASSARVSLSDLIDLNSKQSADILRRTAEFLQAHMTTCPANVLGASINPSVSILDDGLSLYLWETDACNQEYFA